MRMVRRTVIAVVSLVFFSVLYPLQTIHSLWRKVVLQEEGRFALSSIREAYAKVLITAEGALKYIFPEAQETQKELRVLGDQERAAIEETADITFDLELDKEFTFYTAKTDQAAIGYALEGQVRGKWGTIHYMVFFNTDKSIRDVVVLEYREKRGEPVAKEKFRKQFRGKTIQDPLRLKKDIRGVSGATISSTGMTDGIRKMVHVFDHLFKK
jgi:Na+-translocating ferredoxin:NAD+ oxidoreductase RnfG subunit